ncbi:MAG: carbohydrate ABC transporter permease [Pleomorphochaeta sp.]
MKQLNRKSFGYLCILPTIIIFAIFAIYPVFRTIFLSFFKYRLQTGNLRTFIGFENYLTMFKDSRFLNALSFTLIFSIITVSVEVILGLIFAQLMNMPFKGQWALRVIVLIPWSIPTIVSGFMWKFMVNDQYGVFNQILYSLGFIENYIPWLSQDLTSRFILILADIWKTSPYVSLLVLAGLQNIPESLNDAAAIDGAGAIRKYFFITLPQLKPVLATAVLFRLISALKIYTVIAALTNGGPGFATESLTMYTMRTFFSAGNYGYGACLSTFTLIITCIISLLFMDIIRNKINTGGKK